MSPASDTLVRSLDRLVADDPDAPALLASSACVSRCALQRRSSAVGRALLERGIQPGDAVAVAIPRSLDSVAAILGALRAGASWVPVDPAHPAERRRFIAEDAEVRATLVVGASDGLDVVDLSAVPSDAEPLCVAGTARLNLLYTSGSTGRPKGVIGTHAALLNRVAWAHRALPYGPGDVQAHRSALGFVDAGPELFGGLLAGVPVAVISPQEQADLARFVRAIASLGVTRLTLVPSLLAALLRAAPDVGAALPALRMCVTSGEELTLGLATRFRDAFPHATLVNLYGTTEVTGDVTAAVFRPGDPFPADRIPLGQPIAGAVLTAHEPDGVPVPDGEVGELWVAGPVLAAGYHRSPQEQAHRFPYVPGVGRVFRTGDRVRRGPDGVWQFLGRVDQRVKINGVRVELGEVERVLAAPGLDCAVVLRDGRLVAVVVDPAAPPGAPTLAPPSLRDALRARAEASLPEGMRPVDHRIIRALPLSPNGKVDRRALAAELDLARSPVPPEERPATVTELRVAEAWSRILGLPGPEVIARGDRFYELGGGSLGIAELLLHLERIPGAHPVPFDVARAATLAELARTIDGDPLPVRVPTEAGVTLTPAAPDEDVIALIVAAAADPVIQVANELPWNLDPDGARAYLSTADGVVIRLHGALIGGAFVQSHPKIGEGVDVPAGAVQLDEWLLAEWRGRGLLGVGGAWPALRAWLASRFHHEVSVVWEDHRTMITVLEARGYRRLGRTYWRSGPDGDGTEGSCEVWLLDLRG